MAGKSNYLEAALLNWVRGTAMPAAPVAVYVGLHSADPDDDNSGPEVTATIRPGGRVAVALGAPAQQPGGETAIASTAIVDFGVSAGAVAMVTHMGVYDAAANGNLLYSAALASPKPVTVGDPVTFPVGSLTLSET